MSIIQSSRITDLETALLAATARIKELEAERDARPVVRWEETQNGQYSKFRLFCGRALLADVWLIASAWVPFVWNHKWDDLGRFPTTEAAKAAVEEALRGLSAKTEGA